MSAVQPSRATFQSESLTQSLFTGRVGAPTTPKHIACLLYRSLRNAALWGPICAGNVHNLLLAALTVVCLLTLGAAHPCNFNGTDGVELCCHEEQPAASVCSLHTLSAYNVLFT
jgi:hypothetical protein